MRDVPDDRKHGVALVLAALPQAIDEVLNNKVLTKSAAQAPSFRHGVKPHVP